MEDQEFLHNGDQNLLEGGDKTEDMKSEEELKSKSQLKKIVLPPILDNSSKNPPQNHSIE